MTDKPGESVIQGMKAPGKKSHKKAAIIGLVVLIILALGALVAVLVINNQQKSADKEVGASATVDTTNDIDLAEYGKAYKKGKKDYQLRMMRGERPTLPVLDEMLPAKGTFKEVPLGIVKIPMNRLVGTKSNARSNAFAGNFMPILSEKSEFAEKWVNLYKSQVNEGIREPIKAYEYMNQFYVEEGNKRVSVMKYVGMDSIQGTVIRIIPKRTEEKENKIRKIVEETLISVVEEQSKKQNSQPQEVISQILATFK